MGVAAATVPNVCKMPGPPAPFVPVPLPNIGKSGDSPKDYSKKVTIEERPDAALAAKVDVSPRNTDLLVFDLGGPDAGTLRRILGEVVTRTSIELTITRWTPRLA
jgi:hypothetical protein